ncbi:hypothetical protein diail_6633 [Diaporthe ilicicola]|nr:hypothetical protein diail_6633 [Diaporthe ilicicola]
MQFTATILAFAAAAAATATPSTCTFGQYVCSEDGLSILQCDISGYLVVSTHFGPKLNLSWIWTLIIGSLDHRTMPWRQQVLQHWKHSLLQGRCRDQAQRSSRSLLHYPWYLHLHPRQQGHQCLQHPVPAGSQWWLP